MTTLTLDLGTSATKGALWDGVELAAITRSPIATSHPEPGRAEQDPDAWWASVVDVCAQLRRADGARYDAIDAVGFAAARETFALFDASLAAVSAGILWSDRRAADQVAGLGDGAEFRARTGVVLSPGCCRAKVRWTMEHEPAAWRAARWLLSPRDLVIARTTGKVVTDETLASRTGCYDLDGDLLEHDAEVLLPPVVTATTVLQAAAGARDLGLRDGVSVIVGAGDRACEVLGVGATTHTPMVSWGTTANVSVPEHGPAAAFPTVAQVSRGALGGFLVEAGLSAAGAAIAWLARLTGREHDDLLHTAAAVAPGAGGVVALPWLAGARAPWWEAGAHAAFLGLTEAHSAPELARAVVEGVAYDVARCLELVAPEAAELALAGGGAADASWREVVAGVTGCSVVRRAIDDAASVGARLLVAVALGEVLPLDDVNPVVAREAPDRALVDAYASLRETADALASAVIDVQ
ncbi:MAG TPA: FGGY-family carbohydrate kinase [Acidimicrobiia bacterium]